MNWINIIGLAVLATLVACSTEGKRNQTPTEEIEHVEVEAEPKHEQEDEGKLSLNNGSKWEANVATTEGIENMHSALEKYQMHTDSMSLDTLQMVLFSEFRTLVNKCTMKGEAHEQLHYYILPLKRKIDALKQGDVSENVQELNAHLLMYWDYFKTEK